MTSLKIAAAVTAMSLAAACGGSGSDGGGGGIEPPASVPACQAEVSACGGDVVGTWELETRCLAEPVITNDSCPGEVMTFTDYIIHETLTLTADGTYSSSIVGAADVTIQVPLSCLESTCAEYESEQDLDAMAGVGGSVECSAVGSECVCDMHMVLDVDVTATYEVLDTMLVVTAGDTVLDHDFCVAGETLTTGNHYGVSTYTAR